MIFYICPEVATIHQTADNVVASWRAGAGIRAAI